jgi:hypothetical protein
MATGGEAAILKAAHEAEAKASRDPSPHARDHQ